MTQPINQGYSHALTLVAHTMDPRLTAAQICRRIGEALEAFTYEGDGFVPEQPMPIELMYPELKQ